MLPNSAARAIASGQAVYTANVGTIKGQGTFAARLIKGGTLISVEMPIIAVDLDRHDWLCGLYREYLRIPAVARTQYNALRADKTTLTEDLLAAYNSVDVIELMLYGSHVKDKIPVLEVLTIWRTNSVLIKEGLGAVYPKFSRVNHCCAPNSRSYLDKESGAMRVISITDIRTGEEVTAAYKMPLFQPSSVRTAKIGLRCICKVCSSPYLQQSDQRRQHLDFWAKSILQHNMQMMSANEVLSYPAREPLVTAHRYVEGLRVEGLFTFLPEAYEWLAIWQYIAGYHDEAKTSIELSRAHWMKCMAGTPLSVTTESFKA
ncbi:hypothetical protein F4802DRAFT_291775 [Xylaria palmicola]|nr:hypothetical protein F4802DRAFT_291775 [Xylaria palmicola]